MSWLHVYGIDIGHSSTQGMLLVLPHLVIDVWFVFYHVN